MRLSITVSPGSEVVRQGLEEVTGEGVKVGRRRMFNTMNRITRRMEEYPPERPGQKYLRTGRLGFSWYVDRINEGYMVRNDARDKYGRRYPHWVVGDAYGTGQAWMHRRRWPVFRTVAEEEIDELPPMIANHIVMVARRKGYDAQ